MNAPAIFQNDEFQLRVTAVGNSFRVEAPSMAKALGFHEARDLVRSIPAGEKGSELVPTPGGAQSVWYLTEPGFYRALGQRQAARIKDTGVRDQVTRFQGWVYGDVLPAIRKTGTYAIAPATPSADVATISRRELAQMILAEADRADAAEQRVAELAPAAEAYEVIAGASGDYSWREAAHILNRDPAISTGQNRLAKFAKDEGMLDRKGIPYIKHSGHLVERAVVYDHPRTGEPVLTTQIRVTPAGIEYLRKRMGGIGREVTA